MSNVPETYKTRKGGIVTIIGRGEGEKVLVECSICSKDKELFPELYSYRGVLRKGIFPCGCSKQPKWKEHQWKVIVDRRCQEIGYDFLGWEGDFKGIYTYLKLFNPKTGNLWSTTIISNFIHKGHKDPNESFQGFSDEDHIRGFFSTGRFTEGTTFWRDSSKTSYWFYSCPVCSEDEFVNNGVCDGIFRGLSGNLKNGNCGCRCSSHHKFTEEERVYMIQKVCHEEGLTFLGFEGKYRNSKTPLIWLCKEGHKNSTGIYDFLEQGTRCRKCAWRSSRGNGNGYLHHRRNERDLLYILSFGQYIKIGRSFEISNRLKNLKKESKIKEIDILYLYEGSHKNVYDVEQAIHKHLEDLGYYHEDSKWSTETFENGSIHDATLLLNSCSFMLDKIYDHSYDKIDDYEIL